MHPVPFAVACFQGCNLQYALVRPSGLPRLSLFGACGAAPEVLGVLLAQAWLRRCQALPDMAFYILLRV